MSERTANQANFSDRIFRELNTREFGEIALDLFREAVQHNMVYSAFVRYLGIDPQSVDHYAGIPFLPVSFFKNHQIIRSDLSPEKVFLSSGTTGMQRSRHYVASLDLYRTSLQAGFKEFFGDPSEFYILALMPAPEEAPDSSLVFMMQEVINASAGGEFLRVRHPAPSIQHPASNIKKYSELARNSGRKVLIVGVTYALLDLAESGIEPDPTLLVFETGGMKGRRTELIREEVHERLKAGFGLERIGSEYGMSELLSQAWSLDQGLFRCPPWMKVLIRDPNDPLSFVPHGQTGGISIIDLANRNSCPFIATQDLGRSYPNGSFEVLGRFDDSDIRGCSLLA